MEILAGFCGLGAGLLGVAPFVVLKRLMRRYSALRDMRMVSAGLLGTILSFFLMAIALVLCAQLAREQLLIFTAACLPVFLLGTVFVAWRTGVAPTGVAPTGVAATGAAVPGAAATGAAVSGVAPMGAAVPGAAAAGVRRSNDEGEGRL
ncbi:MAG: hypothetical protein LBO07_05980 [Coriobacteriales bacterium]|nr:hypothetical protein [Coriobacteriales bacterium]